MCPSYEMRDSYPNRQPGHEQGTKTPRSQTEGVNYPILLISWYTEIDSYGMFLTNDIGFTGRQLPFGGCSFVCVFLARVNNVCIFFKVLLQVCFIVECSQIPNIELGEHGAKKQ